MVTFGVWPERPGWGAAETLLPYPAASLFIQGLLFLAGLAGLFFGAKWLVGGSSSLAASYGVSPAIAGLTVVALGTSAPELLVSALASAEGSGGLAVGNVVGSNIANIALILGVAALISPIRTDRGLMMRDLPVSIAFALLLLALGWDGEISRLDGVALLALFALYMGWLIRGAAKTAERLPVRDEDASRRGQILRVGLGIITLVAGAQMLVSSATAFARVFGVPEVVIGLTLVALGTSVPELAASAVAAWRRESDIVLGNVLGSNIFNVALILGVAALLRPLPISREMATLQIPAMIAASVLLFPIVATGLRINRWEGAALLGGYGAFIFWTVA